MALKFSLQNVLDLRHSRVEVLEIELGKRISALQETRALLDSLFEFRSYLLDELGAAQTGEIDLVKFNLLRSNLLQTEKRISAVTVELQEREKAVEEKRAELVAAKQAEETLAILKRKRQEAYLAEQLQIEAHDQDEIYIAQAFRNQQQGA